MNAPPSVAVGLLLDTLHAGLLRPGARIVLTFKSGAERKNEWQTVVDAQVERLRAVADDVRVLHLFANTSKECTVVCTLAAAAAPAPAAGAAPRLQCCSSRRPWVRRISASSREMLKTVYLIAFNNNVAGGYSVSLPGDTLI